MSLLRMACSRRKKTVLYGLFVGALVYMGVQVIYLSETFTPLMMMSDAQSEASRLLKFITLYHYQCNSSIQMFNRTDWPLCTDKEYGVDVDSRGPKRAYSIGPSWDFMFERNLVYNHSYNLFIYSLEDVPRDLKETNHTHFFKTMIVANDPADFGRNSYDTQTINNVMQTFHHHHIDILKIDRLADRSHAYELLYYMTQDHILQRIHQLHITVHIDKLDDDYLYRWYRAFYNLFYKEGFRLYHTAASDSLCLQVTMMESCVYYTSWIRNPGPRVFVMHPPAIDGSSEFEKQRLVNYVSVTQASCDDDGTANIEMMGPSSGEMQEQDLTVCASTQPTNCHVVIMSTTSTLPTTFTLEGRECEVISLSPSNKLYTEPHVIMRLPKGRRSLPKLPRKKEYSLREVASLLRRLRHIDLIYMDLSVLFWSYITPVLDLGMLQNVGQLAIDLVLYGKHHQDKHPVELRRKFSEMHRLEAQGFKIVHTSPFKESKLHFLPFKELQVDCCYLVTLLNKNNLRKT